MGVKVYDLKSVVVTVGTVRVEGFGPNDAVQFEWGDDLAVPEVGADGQVTVSKINNRSMACVLTLMSTSESYRRLALLMDQQWGVSTGITPPILVPLPFVMADPLIGDLVTDETFVFLSRPAPSKGRQAGVVQFRGLLPDPNVNYGSLNNRLV